MPDLGRWFGMDQLSEIYDFTSPYAYVMNNPAMFVDPDGRDVKPTKDGWNFTGEDIADIYGYLTGGGSVSSLTKGLSAWGDTRTGQSFWGFFDSWKNCGSYGGGGNIYVTTASDGAISGKVNDIQGVNFTKTKIASTFSDDQIMQDTQASWRTGGGVIMMDGISDIFGILLAEAKPKNRYLAYALGAAAIIATKGRAADEVLRAEMAVEKAEMKTVYRVFGGDSRAQGFSWTPIDPTTIKDFRNLAGLPSGGASGVTNTAEFMIKGEVGVKNIIKARGALPLDGMVGGLPEYIINPNHVSITGFSVLTP